MEGDERPDSSAVPSLVTQAGAIRRLCFHSATPLVHVSRKRVWWSRDAHLNEDVWRGRWGGEGCRGWRGVGAQSSEGELLQVGAYIKDLEGPLSWKKRVVMLISDMLESSLNHRIAL